MKNLSLFIAIAITLFLACVFIFRTLYKGNFLVTPLQPYVGKTWEQYSDRFLESGLSNEGGFEIVSSHIFESNVVEINYCDAFSRLDVMYRINKCRCLYQHRVFFETFHDSTDHFMETVTQSKNLDKEIHTVELLCMEPRVGRQ